jgi:hypothetical protein
MEEFWLRYMDKDKSTTPINENGQAHGHWIAYDKDTDDFWFECNYVNGVEYGYEKWKDEQTFYHAL